MAESLYECEIEKTIGDGQHIADVVVSCPKQKNGYTIKGQIIELQHSGITSEEMIDRCVFYLSNGYKTTWLFDMKEKYKNGHINFKKLKGKGNPMIFNQKWQKRILNSLVSELGFPAFGKIFVDIGYEKTFMIRKTYENGNGWGYFVKPDKVFERIK